MDGGAGFRDGFTKSASEPRNSTMWAMGAHSFRLSISIKLTDHDLFVWK